jgi:hypothetical protein
MVILIDEVGRNSAFPFIDGPPNVACIFAWVRRETDIQYRRAIVQGNCHSEIFDDFVSGIANADRQGAERCRVRFADLKGDWKPKRSGQFSRDKIGLAHDGPSECLPPSSKPRYDYTPRNNSEQDGYRPSDDREQLFCVHSGLGLFDCSEIVQPW